MGTWHGSWAGRSRRRAGRRAGHPNQSWPNTQPSTRRQATPARARASRLSRLCRKGISSLPSLHAAARLLTRLGWACNMEEEEEGARERESFANLRLSSNESVPNCPAASQHTPKMRKEEAGQRNSKMAYVYSKIFTDIQSK